MADEYDRVFKPQADVETPKTKRKPPNRIESEKGRDKAQFIKT